MSLNKSPEENFQFIKRFHFPCRFLPLFFHGIKYFSRHFYSVFSLADKYSPGKYFFTPPLEPLILLGYSDTRIFSLGKPQFRNRNSFFPLGKCGSEIFQR